MVSVIHDKQNATEHPNINTFIDRVLKVHVDHFWGPVHKSCVFLEALLIFVDFGFWKCGQIDFISRTAAKIAQLGHSIFGQQNILHLDILMKDAYFMHFLQAQCCIIQYLQNLQLAQFQSTLLFSFHEHIINCLRTVFHQNVCLKVSISLDFMRAEVAHYMSTVRQFLHHCDFLVVHLFLFRCLTQQFLHCIGASCFHILDQAHKPITAFSQLSHFPQLFSRNAVNRERTEQAEHVADTISHIIIMATSSRTHRLHGISQEVESQYSEGAERKRIPQEVLDKYLTVGNGQFLKYCDKLLQKVSPVWTTTQPQTLDNLTAVFTGHWNFSQTNYSIYWAIWGPISLVFFCYLLHSAPFQNKLNLSAAGLIDLGLILILSFSMFVYSNVMHFPFQKFIYHVCVSSHISLITILHCMINVAGPDALVIPMSFVYIGLCSFLHFRIYNEAIKPTLIEFVILLIIIAALYSAGAYLLYLFLLKMPVPAQQHQNVAKHSMTLRYFNF